MNSTFIYSFFNSISLFSSTNFNDDKLLNKYEFFLSFNDFENKDITNVDIIIIIN